MQTLRGFCLLAQLEDCDIGITGRGVRSAVVSFLVGM